MNVLFFRCALPAEGADAGSLPPGVSLRIWRPTSDGFPAGTPFRRANLPWWIMDKAGLFARRGFSEVSLWRGECMVHRLILTPRWYRFPFMSSADFQVGDIWTNPAFRGRGFASAGVRQALGLAGRDGNCVWYVTDAGNRFSIALAERCGFTLAGRGYRSRPFGLHLAGRYFRENAAV